MPLELAVEILDHCATLLGFETPLEALHGCLDDFETAVQRPLVPCATKVVDMRA